MPATPAWPPRSAPRLFVAQRLEQDATVVLDGGQASYLGRVMRVRAGDTVILCDDQTGEWAAEVVSADKRNVDLKIVRQLRQRESVPDFWLCPALLKKDRFDWVLEKATELGAACIAPMITRRCVADKLNLDRARTLLTEAAEQCARTALPELRAPEKLDALLRDWPADRTLYFADEELAEPRQSHDEEREAAAFAPRSSAKAAVLIGPEGGFDEAERAAILALPQAIPLSLGPRILRAETAAIAATTLWMAQAGDWGQRE